MERMENIKPTKEFEERMKTVLEGPDHLFEFGQLKGLDRAHMLIMRIPWKLRDKYFDLRAWFQRKIRKHGCSDSDFWNLDMHLCDTIIPKLEAFREYKRHGYPGRIEPDPDFKGEKDSNEEFHHCLDKWNKILDEMIAEFKAIRDEKFGEKIEYDMTLESKYVQYRFRNTKDESCVFTEDFDYDEKHPEYKFERRIVSYKTKHLPDMKSQPKLFCEWFSALWD